jgi:hypothetical protein
MNEQTRSGNLPAATDSQQARSSTSGPVPSAWVERLFERLSGFYGSKFGDLWRGCDIESVKRTWSDALAGYGAQEIKRGLDACLTRTFPPTLPEFLTLCRPKLDHESAYIEACKQISARDNGSDVWSTPAIFWAAREYGAYELRQSTWQSAKVRWCRLLDEQLSKPEQLPVPARMTALPEPGAGTADPRKVAAALELLKQSLRSKSKALTDGE